MVFEKATFFTTEELFTGKKTLQSKVFSAGVAGIADIRGLVNLSFLLMLSLIFCIYCPL